MSQVSVKILQQDYVLSCPDGQENALLEAVAKANNAMQPLCDKAKVRTREQAAVLVAVNFAFQNHKDIGNSGFTELRQFVIK